jgi:hypothetical protein
MGEDDTLTLQNLLSMVVTVLCSAEAGGLHDQIYVSLRISFRIMTAMNVANATYPVNSGPTKDNEVQDSIVRNHPIYWFEDGSLVLDVEVQRFKVHRTLVSRHSRFFASLSTPQGISGSGLTTSGSSGVVQTQEFDHIVLEQRKEVKAEDVEALLQHLYHDV